MGLRFLISFFLVSIGLSAKAELIFPRQLNHDNRANVLKILGPATGYKNLGDPFPLGGYMGLELGLSYELIPTAEIAKMGSGAAETDSTSFMNLSFAKGLYHNVDISVQFAPPGQWEEFSSFGAALRWGFYELPLLPIHFSVQATASSAGFSNKVNTTTQSVDLIGGWNLEDIVLYLGLGTLRSSATFIGGADGVTDGQENITETLNATRGFMGLSIKYDSYFVAIQADSSTRNFYSARIGARF